MSTTPSPVFISCLEKPYLLTTVITNTNAYYIVSYIAICIIIIIKLQIALL